WKKMGEEQAPNDRAEANEATPVHQPTLARSARRHPVLTLGTKTRTWRRVNPAGSIFPGCPALPCKPRIEVQSNYRQRHEQSPERSRSEEHTSELQSRGHLVCRLLLEKKKTRERFLPHSSYRVGHPLGLRANNSESRKRAVEND